MSIATQVKVQLTLELGAGLTAMVSQQRLGHALRGAAQAELERIGLASSAGVHQEDAHGTRLIRVHVNRTLVPYPPSLLVRAWLGAASPEHQALARTPKPGGGFQDAWLIAALEAVPDEGERARTATRVMVLLTRALMRRRPDLLLEGGALDAYVDAMRASVGGAVDDVPWKAILPRLLALTGTLADHAAVADAVLGAIGMGLSGDDAVESAFAALRRPDVELVWGAELPDPGPEGYTPEGAKRFRRLGLALPDVAVRREGADATRLEIRVAGVPGVPITMFRPGELLVEQSVERLAEHDIAAREALHPVTGDPVAIVSAELRDELPVPEFEPVEVRTIVGRLLAREVDEHRGRLMSTSDMEHQLALLRVVAPATVRAAVATFPLAELTRIGRLLVEDGISVANLTDLLTRLLDYEVSRTGRAGALAEPPAVETNGGGARAGRAEEYADAVRAELGDLFASRFARDGALTVIDVDPRLESRLAASPVPGRLEQDQIRDATWTALAGVEPGPQKPIVLTPPRTRRTLSAILADELPWLPVLSAPELPLGLERRVVGTLLIPGR